MRRICAARLRAGHVIENGRLAPLYVIETSTSSLGSIVLRCSYSPDGYPATALLLPPGELVGLL